jgi:hypothetical protein
MKIVNIYYYFSFLCAISDFGENGETFYKKASILSHNYLEEGRRAMTK